MTVKSGNGSNGNVNSARGSGVGDSASAYYASVTASHAKKLTTQPTKDVTHVELMAELNSRLAKLTDSAVSDISRRLPTVTKTNSGEHQLSGQAVRCARDAVTSAQSVLKASIKSGEREGQVAKQRNSTLAAETGLSRPNMTPSSLNSKSSSLPHQARPAPDTRVSNCLIFVLLVEVAQRVER